MLASSGSDARYGSEKSRNILQKKLPFICTPTLTLNDILNVGDTLIYRYAVKHARKQEIKRLEEKELLEFIEAIKKRI
ncbi:hypothetical protein QM027_04990 [Campylobacter concisus]